jgi:hypothetical protein
MSDAGLPGTARCPCCPAEVEDDLHVVGGCPGTGSIDAVRIVGALWLQVAHAKRAQVTPLPELWISEHLRQLAAALIPTAVRAFMPQVDLWMVPVLLRDFHQKLAERLAEVMRRRETIVGLALQATGRPLPPRAAFVPPPEDQARQLTVPELRAAENRSAGAAPPPAPKISKAALAVKQKEVGLDLPAWIKQHRFLRAVPVAQGEASVALMLLWETDHGQMYPSKVVSVSRRTMSFSKRLQEVVGADPVPLHLVCSCSRHGSDAASPLGCQD